MGVPVLILGESGSGKSTSLRNFKPDEYLLLNVAGKPLPFRGRPCRQQSPIQPYPARLLCRNFYTRMNSRD